MRMALSNLLHVSLSFLYFMFNACTEFHVQGAMIEMHGLPMLDFVDGNASLCAAHACVWGLWQHVSNRRNLHGRTWSFRRPHLLRPDQHASCLRVDCRH